MAARREAAFITLCMNLVAMAENSFERGKRKSKTWARVAITPLPAVMGEHFGWRESCGSQLKGGCHSDASSFAESRSLEINLIPTAACTAANIHE